MSTARAFECRARRRGRYWGGQVPEHGVYGQGRTLRALRDNLIDGLASLEVTAEVTVVAEIPELDIMRAAQQAYTTALREAVTALARSSVTVPDIAAATGISPKGVQALLAETMSVAEEV